jgi:probable phosphoglycerate mutase
MQRHRRTTVLLVRHALTDAVGVRLSGRAEAVPLSASGLLQAERLGLALASRHCVAAIYTSPLERARTTAAALSRYQAVVVSPCDDLVDIDFGAWSGRTFAELADDPAWQLFNTARADARVPGGEHSRAVQHRIVAAIARLAAAHEGEEIALVSHCDVIRYALLHYQSLSLDLCHSIAIEPASVSVVVHSPESAMVVSAGDTTFAAEPPAAHA